ncbi:ABC transporter ATP-binding protein [Bacillus sp. FJAT-45037]|uniref:ABC transporter ATP-binding protein n=1 Tax=Bacillus sp. FJAT-45037 TaxID=2011007 RepID=UPI000C236188|nr:ABC transporter ATP-binding protein [Bacillus sp. FJAT-45037]
MLEVLNVFKSYNYKNILVDANLRIHNGEIVGLIGKNGVGKTTLIKLITGIEKVDAGDIKINGNSVNTEVIDAKYSIGFVTDVPNLYHLLTGKEYLEFIADMWKLDKETREHNIRYYLNILHLKELENQYIHTYSLGTKQKLALAGALIHNPKLLILDEPLTGVDMEIAKEIINIIKDFAQNGGTVLFTSHIFQIINSLSTRIVSLSNNKINECIKQDNEPLKEEELVKFMTESS